MLHFTQIHWDFDPRFFPALFESIGLEPRWYGLLFAAGFLVGFRLIKKILIRENMPEDWADSLLLYVMAGTVLGARLGHVFFYDWAYYSQNLNEILMIWKGGLASHGAAVGNIIALWLWSKKVSKKPVLWALDRVVITIALAGSFIRLGNFLNSEIIGSPTNLPWAVVFKRVDLIPRHPSQIYESIGYLIIFLLLYIAYFKFNKGKLQGYIFGAFLILIFGFRFIIEFVKAEQKAFEVEMTLNMGQWLSIPLVLAGIFFLWRSKRIAEAGGGSDQNTSTAS